METVGGESAKSKKQQRDARRLHTWWQSKREHARPSEARWLLLTQRLLTAARKEACDAVRSALARSRITPEARQAARRKLRDVLWREWTRRQFDPPPLTPPFPGRTVFPTGLQVLGARSLRDEYILARVRNFHNHSSGRASGLGKAVFSWMGFRRVIDFDRIYPGARSREAAGLNTPASARNRKKSRGGKKSEM